MKTILAVCLAAAAPLLAAEGGAMNDAERSFLLDQMEKSKKVFLESIDGVTAEQWKFKPAPNVWSVAECAEHIVLSEGFLFKVSQDLLKSPAVARPETSNSEQDRKLAMLVEDRSHKATAPEPITPSGKINSPADAAKAFIELRDKNMAYVRTSNDDLRLHVTKGPIGTMDAYQFLLLMATHTARHTAQIREVEANANYPKATAKAHFLVTYTLAVALPKMTDAQRATIGQHRTYVQQQADAGRLTWGGLTNDPVSPHGFVLLEVPRESDARDYVKNDPGVKAGLLAANVESFTEVVHVR